jgi:hypothetical protein
MFSVSYYLLEDIEREEREDKKETVCGAGRQFMWRRKTVGMWRCKTVQSPNRVTMGVLRVGRSTVTSAPIDPSPLAVAPDPPYLAATATPRHVTAVLVTSPLLAAPSSCAK